MTKTIAYNDRQLDVVLNDIYNQYRTFGEVQVDYCKPYKEKTLRQLGFFWGALIDSVVDFYKDRGDIWKPEDVKENFYSACSQLDERLKKSVRRFNGDVRDEPVRLSEMDIDTASIFIDKCIYLIDNAKCFSGLILHPSIRYTWIRHIKQEDIDALRWHKFPREDKVYLEHTRKQACIFCGVQNQSEVHHIKMAGYSGTAYKSDDYLTIPLCHQCHIGITHQKGQETLLEGLKWITKYIPLDVFCKIRYLKWKYKK